MSYNEVVVFYGTETGNSQDLAEKSIEILESDRIKARIDNLELVKPDDLTKIERAIFIVSTWGEGDPPLDAEDFYNGLQEFDQNLYNLRYGIMGLGDRSYSIFNGFAKDLDNSLGKLGATRLGERVQADLDYEDEFEDFIKKMCIIFK